MHDDLGRLRGRSHQSTSKWQPEHFYDLVVFHMIIVFTELNVPEIFSYYHVFYSCRMKSTEIHSSLVSPTLITVTQETY